MADPDPQAASRREPVRFLVFSASLRADSLNTCLARLATAAIEVNGGSADLRPMADFETPTYNADSQEADGFPPGADRLRECVQTSDAFVISSPEYNSSMPGGLKNALDWVSRSRPQPFNEKHCLLLSASPSMVGGNRGLWSLRVPLDTSGYASTRTCSRSPRPTRPSVPTSGSPTRSCRSASTPTSSPLWTWSRRPSTTRARRAAG